jgi:hypothetical protein
MISETWLKQSTTCPIPNTILDMRVINDTNLGREGREGIIAFPSKRYRNQCQLIKQDTLKQWAILKLGQVLISTCYFTPSTPDTRIIQFLNIAKEECENGLLPMIIVGDFNARMGIYNGDHRHNPRGIMLKTYLEESTTFFLNEPEHGKYTTITKHGKGICDIVISTHQLYNNIQELTVHETYSLGGSDHRPITMIIQ